MTKLLFKYSMQKLTNIHTKLQPYMDTLLKHLIYQNNKLNLKNYDHRKKKELQEKQHYSESS